MTDNTKTSRFDKFKRINIKSNKILQASLGPVKAISIVWIFLLLIITFIYFIFFDPKGLLNIQNSYPLTFGVVTILFAGLLFLYWLIVWNALIKAFFREDLTYMEKNGIKLEEVNG
ncbi:MAG: hypothetical protein FK734_19765 [Asgard group archaeon]|nr:hypothetical protein [Asgard group archaeon]